MYMYTQHRSKTTSMSQYLCNRLPAQVVNVRVQKVLNEKVGIIIFLIWICSMLLQFRLSGCSIICQTCLNHVFSTFRSSFMLDVQEGRYLLELFLSFYYLLILLNFFL